MKELQCSNKNQEIMWWSRIRPREQQSSPVHGKKDGKTKIFDSGFTDDETR